MTPQELNFNSVPLVHKDDPITSFESAETVQKSGKLKQQCEAVFQAIKNFPNSTAGELARSSNIDYQIIQRRVSILERNGLIKRRSRRVCAVNHTKQTVWESAL